MPRNVDHHRAHAYEGQGQVRNQPVVEARRLLHAEAGDAVVAPGLRGDQGGDVGLRVSGERLAREGVPFRDLSMVFRDDPEPRYVDDCCHLDVRGYEMLAAPVAADILRRFEERGR